MLTTLTPTTLIIAILGILAGYVTQGVNSGSLFGVVTVPKAWLPYLTLVATFLAAFVASVGAANPVDKVAWTNAALAGFIALMGHGLGTTIKQATDAHKRDKTPVPAADIVKAVAAPAPTSVAPPAPPTPPAAPAS